MNRCTYEICISLSLAESDWCLRPPEDEVDTGDKLVMRSNAFVSLFSGKPASRWRRNISPRPARGGTTQRRTDTV